MNRSKTPVRITLSAMALALVAGLAVDLAAAATRNYALDLPGGQMIAYKIEFAVPHPGQLSVEAEWSGTRVVSFKLEGPDGAPPEIRRSGPPPQRIQFDVPPSVAGSPGLWKLSIRGLPASDSASGSLRLHLPDAYVEPQQPVEPVAPPAPREPWLRPRTAPGAVSPELSRLHETAERFRITLVEEAGRDRYNWQSQFLRYVAERRDGLAPLPDESTRRLLERSAHAVRRVHRLASSRDPFVVEPPSDRGLLRAWLSLRQRRLEPLEMELDSMLQEIHRGHAPELEIEPWFGRFMSCLIACEQHFEQRGRLGAEMASNGDLVEEQWDRLRLAAEALDSLAALAKADDPE